MLEHRYGMAGVTCRDIVEVTGVDITDVAGAEDSDEVLFEVFFFLVE